MNEKDKERAKSNAKAGLESIVDMVKRLKHAEECDGGDDCESTDEEILGGINIYYKDGMKASEEEKSRYHDIEEARQSIQEDPLSLEVRSGWHAPGENTEPDEYNILLGTGGPALRIVGDLDRDTPTTAKLEYQDWFTPWMQYTETISEEDEALLEYAQQFYFGA